MSVHRGSPEAIRQANNLINAMVEEPDKDVTELLTQANKGHKAIVEEFPSQKVPVTITDFAIGTFTVPVTSSTSLTSKSPVRSKTAKQSKSHSGSHSSNSVTNTMGPTIGAWQNPIPGQVLPSSPRRSPLKQVIVSSSVIVSRPGVAATVEKGSARQLTFSSDRSKRSASPVLAPQSSSASLSFTPTATSTNKGLICTTKAQDPRLQSQPKSSMAVSSPMTSPVVRFPHPASTAGPRLDGLPLPIVTNGSSSHAERSMQARSSTPSNQSTPGEYNPFNSSIYTNFLTKKEEKTNFASVAAAGVVTTTPSPQTISNPTQSTSNIAETVDPVLQAKAPGFKTPQQGLSPHYRHDTSANIGGYHMSPVGNASANSVQGLQTINSGMRAVAPIIPYMDDYQMSQMLQYQYLNQIREKCNPMIQTFVRMELGAASLTMPPGVYPQGMPGVPIPSGQQSQQQPQKEEYSKPHRPMTLPEIKGGLNPNAPEFQLSSNGPLMIGDFDHPVGSGIVGIPLPDISGRPSLAPTAGIDFSGQNTISNPGTNCTTTSSSNKLLQKNFFWFYFPLNLFLS